MYKICPLLTGHLKTEDKSYVNNKTARKRPLLKSALKSVRFGRMISFQFAYYISTGILYHKASFL